MKRKLKLLLLSIVIIAVVGTSVYALFFWEREDVAVAAFQSAQATSRDLSSRLLVSSTLTAQPGAEANIYAGVAGTVKEVLVSPGTDVEAGQVLLNFVADDLEIMEIQVARAKADYAQAEARLKQYLEGARPEEVVLARNNLKEAELNLEHARLEFEQIDELFAAGGISGQQLDNARKALTTAEIKVDNARQQLALTENKYTEADVAGARAQVEQARANLKDAELRLVPAVIASPIAGTVASVNVNPGDTVAKEGSTSLLTILDLTRLQVEAYVDETEIGKVLTGQNAVTLIDTFPGEEFTGSVAFISLRPFMEGSAVYFTVTIELDQSDPRLRPGLTADTEILLEERENVLVVPSEAIRRIEGKQMVYITENGRYETREVVTGYRDLRYTEITDGLQPGETVVTEGFEEIEDKRR